MDKPAYTYQIPAEDERKNNLYVNLTNRCPNNCPFCFRNREEPYMGVELKMRSEEEPAVDELVEEIGQKAKKGEFAEIVFVGLGEPMLRWEAICAVAKEVKAKSYAKRVRVDTTGQVGMQFIGKLKDAGVDAFTFSVNGSSIEEYGRNYGFDKRGKDNWHELAKNAYNNSLKFIEGAKNEGFDLEITCIPEVVEDRDSVRAIAKKFGASFRVRHLL